MPITRTNYRPISYGKKQLYGIIGSYQDSIVWSGDITAMTRDVASGWAGFTCSLRFIKIQPHTTGGVQIASSPIVYQVTATASTSIFYGVVALRATQGTFMTGPEANLSHVFDWEAIIVSV